MLGTNSIQCHRSCSRGRRILLGDSDGSIISRKSGSVSLLSSTAQQPAKNSHMTKRPPSHAGRNESTPRAARSRARSDRRERKSQCKAKSKPSLPLCRDMLLQARSLIVFLTPQCSQARRAARRLKPTVGEAKMSNGCGSGRKSLSLLRHQSGFSRGDNLLIPSNSERAAVTRQKR